MKATRRFLILLAGVTVISTAAMAQQQVTFTKNVAAILQQRCQTCHRPGTVAPMSLVKYEEVRPWARAIKARVAAREMPPWFIDKGVGLQHFDNDNSLTDQEIETLIQWVDAGAPQGNSADMPPQPQFPDAKAWQIGKPDLIISLPKDLIMKAQGPDWWPEVLVDTGLTEDRYIQAIQIMPTKGYENIHHIRTALVKPGDATVLVGGDAVERGAFLDEYAIGKEADIFKGDAGRLITAGSKINLVFHIHASGKEAPINVLMGLKFFPKGHTPAHTVISQTTSGGSGIDIRPHQADARSDSYLPLAKPARLLSWQPHMHLRGKAECLEAILPTGRVQTISCARFAFNWMNNYVYADDVAPLLPAGTVLHAIMWHDNSTNNRFNPDPDAQIIGGQRTVDEMGTAWLAYYFMSDEEFKKETEARKAKQETLTSER